MLGSVCIVAKNNDLSGVWRTIGGRRVFIKNGQDLATAMKESGKFKTLNKKAEDLKQLNEQIKYIQDNQDKLYDIVENNNNYDKELCVAFQERNGFNNKPTVLNTKDFDSLSADDYIKVYRGYHDGQKSAEDYINQFKYGKNEYGNGGIAYGVGHYTIIDKLSAQAYGKTVEIAIPKSARIIDHDDLLEQHYKNFEEYNNNLEQYYNKYGDKVTTILDYMNSNESATAILSNYDVVKQKDMYIILNRGIISVKEGEKSNEQ